MPKNHPYVDGLWNPFMVKLWMVYHCFTNITSMNKTYTPMNSLHAAFECYVWMFIQFQVSALVTRSWYLADSCWFLTKRLQRRLFRLLQSCLWLESCSQMIAQIVAGWWYTYPSEKYESQLGWLFPIYGKSSNSCSKPPTRLSSLVEPPRFSPFPQGPGPCRVTFTPSGLLPMILRPAGTLRKAWHLLWDAAERPAGDGRCSDAKRVSGVTGQCSEMEITWINHINYI